MKNRFISMLCLMAILLSMITLCSVSASAEELWIDKEPAQNVDYSFAVIGDIQTITKSDNERGTRYVAGLMEWLYKNRKSRKISYVFGLGDTVDTLTSYPENYNPSVNNPREWEIASGAIAVLNGVIPYSIVRGNHDDEGGYHKYICTDFYQSQMDGFFYDESSPATRGNSMSNSYRKITIGGHKYLMLTLDYNITDGVKNWANEVISSNPDYHVIVSIHAFLANWGGIYNGSIGQANEVNETEEIYFSGQALWDDVLSRHENVFMILSGHASVPDPIIRTREGVNGNEVIQILVDPQAEDEIVPTGMVLMINIKGGGAEIEFEYLATARSQKQYLSAKNQFTMDVPNNALPIVSTAPSTQPKQPTTTVITTTATTTVTTTVTTKAQTTTKAPKTTAAPTQATTATPATTEAPSKNGCASSVTSAIAVTCILGCSLSALALKKRKEE